MRFEKFCLRVALMNTSTDVTCQISGETISCGEIALTIRPSSKNLTNRWISVNHISEFIEGLREVADGGDLECWDNRFIVRKACPVASKCMVCYEKGSSDEDPFDVVSFYGGSCDSWCHVDCIEEFCDRAERAMGSLGDHQEAKILSQQV